MKISEDITEEVLGTEMSKMADKIPQSVTKQWFFDNGFIEG